MTDTTLEALTARLTGRVSGPGEPGYDEATSPLNTQSRQRPVAVVTARSADDVSVGVRAATELGLRVAVQATGHGAARDLADDTLLIDTSGLDTIEVNAARRVVTVGAGATVGAVNEAAFEHGLLMPGGSAPDVGVTGYTAHGGVGWLTRPHGLASAALLAVDVVDVAGRLVDVDDDRHEDVLWAYRGGGGVGIATRLELQLFPAEQLVAGYLLWPLEHAEIVLATWGAALSSLDPAVSSAMGLLVAPDAPMIPEALRGERVVHLGAATVGGETSAQSLRAVLASLPSPAIDTFGPADPARLAGIHLDPPVAVPALGTGRWLTAEACTRVHEILTAAGTAADDPLAELELRHVAAPPSDVPGAGTSLPSEIVLHVTGGAPAEASRRRVAEALDRVVAAARPADTGLAAASFCDGQDSVPDAYPPEVRDRLAAIDRAVDPDGVLVRSRTLR